MTFASLDKVGIRLYALPRRADDAAAAATPGATPGCLAMIPMQRHVKYSGRIVMIGFGSIGQGVLPLLLRHIDMTPQQITILTAEERGAEVAREYGVRFVVEPLARDNYRTILEPLLAPGDFVLNVSVEVSSVALIELCREKGALYLDTCIEPWPGGYTDPTISPALRSNYAMRESALRLREGAGRAPTAVLTHGANPGLVSHFVKQALLDLARDTGEKADVPQTRRQWGELAQRLGVKVIHIAERDTQVANQPKRVGEFVNTWSIDGFVSEGCQPAELGWGSHEKTLPHDGHRHDFGRRSAIWLARPGASTRVRTWTPLEGPLHGFLITHAEAISISDYFSVPDGKGEALYRPTVHYAYHPCDDAVLSVHEFAGKNWHLQDQKRLMVDEIISGIDELGVLLMGHKRGAYWYGSQLSIEEARRIVPHNNATSLQVTVAVLAGVIWAIENPEAGVVEPEELDFRRILDICNPYLGNVVGAYGDWTPLKDRGILFPEDVDTGDPWQFKNFRVT
jgi:homospermidine synthase